MPDNQGKTIQYRIEYPVTPAIRDPRDFTCPNDAAHYAVEESGLKQEAIARHIGMSKQLLSQKLHGVNTQLSVNEYFRVARALIELGKREWGEFMFKYFAAQLLPEPTRKEKIMARIKEMKREEESLLAELEKW